MRKGLRGGDAAAILIRSININCPVLTGANQGFPEFVAVPRALPLPRTTGICPEAFGPSGGAHGRADMLIESIKIDPRRPRFVGCA
ncbi:hypothetical protein, partial [Burkholderia cenocepacia]|uniref:hypothetical protein n=1 Tax=Burkholderia cenocepacia TaxID=95486 RepID=UPI001F25EEB9